MFSRLVNSPIVDPAYLSTKKTSLLNCILRTLGFYEKEREAYTYRSTEQEDGQSSAHEMLLLRPVFNVG